MAKKRKDGSPLRIWGKMGRPPTEINKKQFEDLCAISPTILECCSVLNCDDVTLNAWCKKTYRGTFSEILPHLAGKGNVSLRRKLWQLALEKDDMRAIEKLSRKHLGMDDSSRPNLILGVHDAKEVNVSWVTDKEEADYFDK